ncbi:MAG: hypothetical protein QHH06_12275 [Clostridiales bacterium]|nr:hypothetical protein [Eubacteriales bacterium]MDH7567229.1 hypothetical protein [Clostridiales bacterium]
MLKTKDDVDTLKKELVAYKANEAEAAAEKLLADAPVLGNWKLVTLVMDGADQNTVRNLFTKLTAGPRVVALLGGTSDGNATLIFGCTKGARVIDRIGKGIRTAPRDVMVSESTGKGQAGMAFGVHKALDMAGSAIGILIAYLILKSSNGNYDYKQIFLISIIPAILSLVF